MKRIVLSLVMLFVTAMVALADVYVVSSETAQVRESDDGSARVMGSLRKGMEINVSKIESGFCEVDFMGVKGFVSINDLKFKSRSGKKSSGSKSHDDEPGLGEKTKDFVSNTSKKVADGVTGFTGKLFGKKKGHKGAEVREAEASDDFVAEEAPKASRKSAATPVANVDGIRKGQDRDAVTADSYRAAVAEAAAHASEVTEEGAAGVIYIFDNHKYICNQLVRFNGNLLPLPELELVKHGGDKGLNVYKRAVTKIVVRKPERIILSRDFTWYQKPYHDELTLDVADGDVYYVELVTGLSSKLNLMKNADGRKHLDKVRKDTKNWTVNPDQYYGK